MSTERIRSTTTSPACLRTSCVAWRLNSTWQMEERNQKLREIRQRQDALASRRQKDHSDSLRLAPSARSPQSPSLSPSQTTPVNTSQSPAPTTSIRGQPAVTSLGNPSTASPQGGGQKGGKDSREGKGGKGGKGNGGKGSTHEDSKVYTSSTCSFGQSVLI